MTIFPQWTPLEVALNRMRLPRNSKEKERLQNRQHDQNDEARNPGREKAFHDNVLAVIAEADKSDPFTAGRVNAHVRNGVMVKADRRAMEAEANSTVKQRKARIEAEFKAWKNSAPNQGDL